MNTKNINLLRRNFTAVLGNNEWYIINSAEPLGFKVLVPHNFGTLCLTCSFLVLYNFIFATYLVIRFCNTFNSTRHNVIIIQYSSATSVYWRHVLESHCLYWNYVRSIFSRKSFTAVNFRLKIASGEISVMSILAKAACI